MSVRASWADWEGFGHLFSLLISYVVRYLIGAQTDVLAETDTSIFNGITAFSDTGISTRTTPEEMSDKKVFGVILSKLLNISAGFHENPSDSSWRNKVSLMMVWRDKFLHSTCKDVNIKLGGRYFSPDENGPTNQLMLLQLSAQERLKRAAEVDDAYRWGEIVPPPNIERNMSQRVKPEERERERERGTSCCVS